MNKKKIWSKTRHFKIETDTEKLDLIDTDVYLDLFNKYNDLQHQLEEKNKVIDEAKEYLIKLGKQPDTDLYYCINEHKEYTELLEILERVKNDN